jgi:hypothetical protein
MFRGEAASQAIRGTQADVQLPIPTSFSLFAMTDVALEPFKESDGSGMGGGQVCANQEGIRQAVAGRRGFECFLFLSGAD